MLERVWRKGNPLTLLVGMQTSTATVENTGDSLKNWPYDSAIPLLGIHTKETRIDRDMCTPVRSRFIIARTWKQPRCLSADEWIRKLRYIYTMEYYSAIKKKTFESVLMRWMKLESVIQSEVNQKEKHQCSMLLLLPPLSCFSRVRLCNPIDGSPPDCPIPGILQARTLEWAAISFSNAWKWKVKVKSLSCGRLSAMPWTAAYQAPLPMGFSRQEYWSGFPLPSPPIQCTNTYIWNLERW